MLSTTVQGKHFMLLCSDFLHAPFCFSLTMNQCIHQSNLSVLVSWCYKKNSCYVCPYMWLTLLLNWSHINKNFICRKGMFHLWLCHILWGLKLRYWLVAVPDQYICICWICFKRYNKIQGTGTYICVCKLQCFCFESLFVLYF